MRDRKLLVLLVRTARPQGSSVYPGVTEPEGSGSTVDQMRSVLMTVLLLSRMGTQSRRLPQ